VYRKWQNGLGSSVSLRARIIPPNPVFELYKMLPVLLELRFVGVSNQNLGIEKR